MKLTAVFLLAVCMQVSAIGFSQNVTLSEKKISLQHLFKKINRQTGFQFFYRDELLNQAGKLDIDVRNMPLNQVLDICFRHLPVTYSIVEKTIVVKEKPMIISAENPAPAQVISGRVTDEKGNPLPGVSIVVRGTKRGTTTTADGSFTLEANRGEVLEFSIVGYKKYNVAVGSSTSLTVHLQVEATLSNEVVVVGYGTQKKVNLTGAVDQVSGERLENRPITNVSEGLQGVMANLNVYTTGSGGSPGATKNINIRGYTGLGTTGSPLILVDGVPADINSINPADIESITVLKDAASSAIYGSRAPYGVVLIKTRQGKKNQPVAVTLNSNFLFSQPVDVPKMMNSLQFVTVYNEAFKNSGQPAGFTDDVVQRVKAYIDDPVNNPVTIKDPNNPANWLTWFGSNANTDWFKVYLKNWSPSEQHNISINGGSDKITYYMGLGYNQKNGLFNFFNDSYKRYNVRANITANVNKWLSLGLRTSFAQANSTSPFAGADIGYNWFHQIPRRFPTVPLKDPNGHYTRESYVPQIMDGGRNLGKSNDSWITGEITLTPVKGWVVNANYSYNYYTGSGSATFLPYNYYNALNQPVSTGTISQLSKNNENAGYHTYNIYTSYEKQLGGHYFKGLIGYQQEYKTDETLYGSNSNLYNNALPSLALTYGNNFSASDNIWAWATEGTFMRFNYNFREKYLFEFDGRYDGSSRFPADRRYAFFPSFSVGYNIAREDFWSRVTDRVTTLKLRASYGSLGDQSSVGYYPYQTTLSTQPPANTNWEFSGGRAPYVRVGGLVDPNLTWAKPSMLDFGVDVGAFNERLQGTFDWYRRKTTDLFGPAQAYPAVLGVSPPQRNNASIETRGFDLTVSWRDKIGQVGYNARFILSNYKGTVLSYPNPQRLITNWYNGMPMGAIWGYTAEGLFQSADEVAKAPSQSKLWSNWNAGDVRYKDLNGDGKIDWGKNTVDSSGDLSIIGNTTPRYSYGFNFSLDWKGFDLNAFIQGIGRREFFTGSNYFWGITGNKWQGTPFTTQLDRWTPDNPNGYFPRFYMTNEMSKNMQTSTRYMLNAAYFRVKNLQVGYTLPQELTRRAHINRLRIYASVENLFTIAPGLHKKFQVDPELLMSDSKIYPVQRTFSVGVNLNLQ